MGASESRPKKPDGLTMEQWVKLVDEEAPQWSGGNRLGTEANAWADQQRATVAAHFADGDQLRLMLSGQSWARRRGMAYIRYYVTNACVGADCDPVLVVMPDEDRQRMADPMVADTESESEIEVDGEQSGEPASPATSQPSSPHDTESEASDDSVGRRCEFRRRAAGDGRITVECQIGGDGASGFCRCGGIRRAPAST